MRATVERLAVVVGLILALAGVILIWVAGAKYERQLGVLREVQDELATIQRRRGTYQRLVENLVSYSRVQPNVDSLLVPFGFKQAAQAPAQPVAPAGSATTPQSSTRPASTPATPQAGGKK